MFGALRLPDEPTTESLSEAAKAWQEAGVPVPTIEAAFSAYAAKCDVEFVAPWRPFGGATSFAELDSFIAAAEQEAAVYEMTNSYQGILDNIFNSADPLDTKLGRVMTATRELQSRLKPKKSLAGRVGNWITALGGGAESEPAEIVGRFASFKDASGDDRWLGVFSNHFKDRDGEIIEGSAHRAFEEYCDRTKNFPELWVWHTPGTAIGKADFVAYDDETGFTLASGGYYPGGKAVVERVKALGIDIGMSHGFAYSRKGNVYTAYRSHEVSILPLERAANSLTGFRTGEENAMKDQKREFMKAALGEPMFEAVVSGLRKQSSDAKAAGLEFKELDDLVAVLEKGGAVTGTDGQKPKDEWGREPGDSEYGKKPKDDEKKETAETDLASTLKAVLAEQLAPIQQKVEGLTADVDALKQDDASRIASAFAGKDMRAAFSATTAKDNLLDPNSDTAKAAAKGIAGKDGSAVNVPQGAEAIAGHLEMLGGLGAAAVAQPGA